MNEKDVLCKLYEHLIDEKQKLDNEVTYYDSDEYRRDGKLSMIEDVLEKMHTLICKKGDE